MFQSITFYVREKTLGIYGEEFPLGTLTTEVLNITPAEYQALDSRLKSAIEGMALYLRRVRLLLHLLEFVLETGFDFLHP